MEVTSLADPTRTKMKTGIHEAAYRPQLQDLKARWDVHTLARDPCFIPRTPAADSKPTESGLRN